MKLSEAKHRLSIPQLWTHFQLPGKAMKSCRCPWRPDRHPSFSVFANGTKWKDHGTGQAGDALDFFQRVSGLSQPDACREFLRMASGGYISASSFPPTSPHRPIIAPPALSIGSESHREALAKTRAVAMLAVELAVERGLVQFGVFRGRNAWFVTDSSRRVVVPHRDAVGADAATRWRRQFGLEGANVSVVPIAALAPERDRMKYLNDLSRMPIDWQAMMARTLVFGL